MGKTRNPSTAPAPKPVDLTTSRIPGGIARWYTPMELPSRRSRLLAVYDITLMPKLRRLMIAQAIIDEEGNKLVDDGIGTLPEGLTKEEAADIVEMNDAAAWAYLKSWSLKRDGVPVPLPTDLDDLLDNFSRPMVDALTEHAGKIIAESVVANTVASSVDRQFAPNGDEDSPSTV